MIVFSGKVLVSWRYLGIPNHTDLFNIIWEMKNILTIFPANDDGNLKFLTLALFFFYLQSQTVHKIAVQKSVVAFSSFKSFAWLNIFAANWIDKFLLRFDYFSCSIDDRDLILQFCNQLVWRKFSSFQ